MHRIQTAEAQFSSVDFLFLVHHLSFQTQQFHKYQSQLCEDHAITRTKDAQAQHKYPTSTLEHKENT